LGTQRLIGTIIPVSGERNELTRRHQAEIGWVQRNSAHAGDRSLTMSIFG
jgi:hypothetical protein